ncbi:hypothetical protein [Sulfuriferula multivorans]|uniref:hypothetical protein n=1 Tax=Sulfuriferula multivorans TaxID=1559896 RepID=UPI000F5BC723|nr:hypothetical protein [Sulfuriferula multivorans]
MTAFRNRRHSSAQQEWMLQKQVSPDFLYLAEAHHTESMGCMMFLESKGMMFLESKGMRQAPGQAQSSMGLWS